MIDGDKNKMDIFIPTRGRPHRQLTAHALREAGIDFWLVCSQNDPELGEYRRTWNNVMAVKATGIMDKRNKILNQSVTSKVLMLDDDLAFYARRRVSKFEKATQIDVVQMVKWFNWALDGHAHAGLIDKFMCQSKPAGIINQGRYNQVLGYNLALFPKPRPQFRLPLNQEHDMHLQLLSQGRVPAICGDYSKDAKYYAAGGLTHMRTPVLEAEVFLKLEKYWPDYVRLRDTKHSISGTAATFNWRKATKERKNAHLHPNVQAH